MSNPELELSSDPVSPALQEVLTLFSADLAEVTFPGVDASTLADLAEQVRARAVDVARARAVLEETRTALLEAQDLLEERAHRAVGYARVFAEGDAELEERLAALALNRGRPRKAARNTPSRATNGRTESAEVEADAEPKKRRKKRSAGPSLPLEPAETAREAGAEEIAPPDRAAA